MLDFDEPHFALYRIVSLAAAFSNFANSSISIAKCFTRRILMKMRNSVRIGWMKRGLLIELPRIHISFEYWLLLSGKLLFFPEPLTFSQNTLDAGGREAAKSLILIK